MAQTSKCPISVIVLTKNEEANIAKCLDSLVECAEVFVVDSGSTDRTCQIAEEYGAKVVQFKWNGIYPKKKQWCLNNLPFTYAWVLFVDADEEMYRKTIEEIADLVKRKPRHDGYFVWSDYVFSARKLEHGHRLCKLILFQRERGRFLDCDDLDVANMWEVEGHYQPIIDGTVGCLRNGMLHNDQKSLFEFIEKLNKYSDWEAALILRNARRANGQVTVGAFRKFLQAVSDRIPFKGAAMFLYCYVFQLGFLDGRPGFEYAVTLGMYHAMISIKCAQARREMATKGRSLGLKPS
jgi:glycosyltransferase involved in cell wall biosynthesis